jgi:UDP-glucose 4-epimerase
MEDERSKEGTMQDILITGGAALFGGILKRKLLGLGYKCVSFDLVHDEDRHDNLVSVRGDLRDKALVEEAFNKHRFSAVQHCAAMMAHGLNVDEKEVWDCNVEATRNVAEACERHNVQNLVYTSTNCLWASNLGHAFAEDQPPAPIEIY